RNVHHSDIREVLEQLAGEMQGGAEAGRAEVELAGIGLGVLDQFLDVVDGQVRVYGNQEWNGRDPGNADEVLERVEGQRGVQARIEDVVGVGHQDGVAVGFGLGYDVAPDHVAGARSVVHHDLLAEPFAHVFGDQSRHDVGTAAGRRRHYEPYGLARPVFGGAAGEGKRRRHGGQGYG